MSVSLYKWTEACEGQPCPGDCDLCNKEPEAKNDDLISRQDAINVVAGIDKYFVKYIEEIPSAEPERKKGKWKITPVYIKCSECGESFMLIPQNFCPNCGADMRGDTE